jgi:hypothetical protein
VSPAYTNAPTASTHAALRSAGTERALASRRAETRPVLAFTAQTLRAPDNATKKRSAFKGWKRAATAAGSRGEPTRDSFAAVPAVPADEDATRSSSPHATTREQRQVSEASSS